MTLREFIEWEIREDHVFDIEEFGTKLANIGWEDGEEIEPEEYNPGEQGRSYTTRKNT